MISVTPAAGLRWLAIVLLLLPLAAGAVQRGEPAPDFELPGPAGMVRLSDYKGKVVYVDFWASWCVPCRQSFPWMNEMLARYRDKGLRVLAVNVDKRASDAAKFLEKTPARFDLAYDAEGKVPRGYEVKAMPSSFLVGADGKVAELHRGFAEEDKAALEAAIRQALGVK